MNIIISVDLESKTFEKYGAMLDDIESSFKGTALMGYILGIDDDADGKGSLIYIPSISPKELLEC